MDVRDLEIFRIPLYAEFYRRKHKCRTSRVVLSDQGDRERWVCWMEANMTNSSLLAAFDQPANPRFLDLPFPSVSTI